MIFEIFNAMGGFELELDSDPTTVNCGCNCGKKSTDYRDGYKDGVKSC